MNTPEQEPSESPGQWECVHSRELNRYMVFRTRRDRVRSPVDGSEHEFDLVDSPAAVTLVALTDDDELVLVEQFRHGTRKLILEFPGGMVDDGEDPLQSGLRELREETGYSGGTAEYLGPIELNPAWQDTVIHVVRVRGVRPTHEKDLDEAEETRVRLVRLDELRERIRDGSFNTAVGLAVLAVHLWIGQVDDATRGLAGSAPG
jgi:ADP-ribose pyrophosphatase